MYERNIEMLKRKQSEAARALIAKRKSDEQVGWRERLSLLQQKLQAPIRIGRTVGVGQAARTASRARAFAAESDDV